MKIILSYLTSSISIVFISWIVGMIITALARKTNFYNGTLSNLNFIESETLNKIIGVGIVKWMVKYTFFKFFNPKLKITRKIDLSDLRTLRAEMNKSEIDHLFAFVFVMIFVVVMIFKDKYLFALIIFVVNILMNLHPSLLQQQNKRRIDKMILKFKLS